MNIFFKKFFFLKRAKKILMYGFSKRAGKNCFGRKTIFTQSGGYRLFFNSIDFNRTFSDIFILLKIEKNVLYTAFLGLICYSNGMFSYILLSDFIKNINYIYPGFVSYYSNKGPNFLKNISSGNFVHHIEIKPSCGAKIMRSAGSMGFIISKEDDYSFLKMKSGWLLKISNYCIAIVGKMSNEFHFIKYLKNAGEKRKLGFRPKVRGIAKNPCDHPHGGGEGRGSPPRAHKTPYGLLTKSPTKIKKFYKRRKIKFKIFVK